MDSPQHSILTRSHYSPPFPPEVHCFLVTEHLAYFDENGQYISPGSYPAQPLPGEDAPVKQHVAQLSIYRYVTRDTKMEATDPYHYCEASPTRQHCATVYPLNSPSLLRVPAIMSYDFVDPSANSHRLEGEPPHGYHSVGHYDKQYRHQLSACKEFWPNACQYCGRELHEVNSVVTLRGQLIYEVIKSPYDPASCGRLLLMETAGAIFHSWWYSGTKMWVGDDGMSYSCCLPNGNVWHIDGIANNCTKKEEFKDRDSDTPCHKCWCRHGEAPVFTVDKNPCENGSTCDAGAGSIMSGSGETQWHGFLREGKLITC